MPTKKYLYQVRLSYATYGIVVQDGYIRRAAPIARWMEGREISDIKKWIINKKGGEIEKVWEGFD